MVREERTTVKCQECMGNGRLIIVPYDIGRHSKVISATCPECLGCGVKDVVRIRLPQKVRERMARISEERELAMV